MKIRELFVKDPLGWKLLNEGVSSNNATDLTTVQYELRTFVCEGEYQTGLVKILSGYLGNFNAADQKAAWISGFYGSGKSHLVKVLRYLWTDLPFEDGKTARGITRLPDDVKDLLKELSTLGKKHQGLHSAGGTLKAGIGSVRLRVLGIIFKSIGLPEDYPYAKFLLHLKKDGHYEEFVKAITDAGKDFDLELGRLYSSKAIAQAYVNFYPHIGGTANVGPALRANYPPDRADISIDEMLSTIREALGKDGKLPCTLIVLDEVQQFIGGNPDLANEVQEVTEACSKQLDGRVMFVGTGQAALSDTPALQRLMGRYTVKTHLRDNDVEKVVRTVVLQKREECRSDIHKGIVKYEGEISRQLKDTKLCTISEDHDAYVPDYPLLPVRRRFWERVLRSVDPTGTAAQMRTQLRVVHEACRSYGDREFGAVVPADFIYDQISAQLVETGEMQKRFQEIIDEQAGKADGPLRRRICSLVFLINKLPREAGIDAGIRAHSEHLCDLLSDDLKEGSTALRQKVPSLLQSMVDDGVLMDIGGEYRLQTTEGAAWEGEYRRRRAAALQAEPQLAATRSQFLSAAMQKLVGNVVVPQGDSKEKRKLLLHFGADVPQPGDGLSVWIRDGFTESDSAVVAEIRRRSTDDPMLHVFVPKANADELKNALASAQAAEETLNYRGTPTTPEGLEARRSIMARKTSEEDRIQSLISGVVSGARLYLSGGQDVPVITLPEAMQDAGKQVLARLYPQFSKGDYASWSTVWRKAKEGNAGALSAIGYQGDPDKHPVAAAIIAFVGPGKKGIEVRKQFSAPPYGWSQDAIDATLATLLLSNHLSARFGGQPVVLADADQRKIGSADYRVESPVLPASQKMELRKLFQLAAVKPRPNEEAADAVLFLEAAKRIAKEAGGDPPAPATPSTQQFNTLESKSGNDLLKSLYDAREALTKDLESWKALAKAIQARLPNFELLEKLQRFTGSLAKSSDWETTLGAIRSNRSLLHDPDPAAPFLHDIADALRSALNKAFSDFRETFDAYNSRLEQHEAWQKLPAPKKKTFLAVAGVQERTQPVVATPHDLLRSLQETSLDGWRAGTDALSTQFDKALNAAIVENEPKARRVHLPSATIRDEAELQAWLKQAEIKIKDALKDGPVII